MGHEEGVFQWAMIVGVSLARAALVQALTLSWSWPGMPRYVREVDAGFGAGCSGWCVEMTDPKQTGRYPGSKQHKIAYAYRFQPKWQKLRWFTLKIVLDSPHGTPEQ